MCHLYITTRRIIVITDIYKAWNSMVSFPLASTEVKAELTISELTPRHML